MRTQLISWMMEDILPKVQTNNDPEGTILKFAHEHNLSPSLVEGLGHLFNTAKTLKYLEKSANRGKTFKIIDVPAMADEFLKTREAKEATAVSDYKPYNDGGLADCFASFYTTGESASATKIASEVLPTARQDNNDLSHERLVIEFAEQARFDAIEDTRAEMQKLAKTFRQNSDISFQEVEQDALFVIGESAKPVMDKLASFFSTENMQVKRASGPGEHRLVRDQHYMLPRVQVLQEHLFRIEAADEIIKQAVSAVDEMAETVRPPKSNHRQQHNQQSESGRGFGESGADKKKGPDLSQKPKPGGEKPKGPPSGGGGGQGKPSSGGFFNKLDSGMSSYAKPLLSLSPYEAEGRAHLMGQGNDQEQLDKTHQDARHIAVLQKLLTTDEVLADADPDRVVSAFNTLREVAPHLAGDANVASVYLRSALQHDGISPFDIKGLADTELSQQKVNFNQRALSGHLYKGQPLGKAA